MKKFEMTKAWCMAMAEQEGTSEVSAGWISRDPGSIETGIIPIHQGRLAFGRLVNLLRRRKRYSLEKLAEEADVDVNEIFSIEEDIHYKPDPRSVYRIADTFGLPQQKLMELAGLVTAQDSTVGEAALRFAAMSEPTAKLTAEERSALVTFLAELGAKAR